MEGACASRSPSPRRGNKTPAIRLLICRHPKPRQLTTIRSAFWSGIGGTGVLTVGALLGMAAHLEGKGATVLDYTGLAQKNGAVMSSIRIANKPEDIKAVQIATGGANLVLGCDMVVAASEKALGTMENGGTRAIVNSHLAPTAAFTLNRTCSMARTPCRTRSRKPQAATRQNSWTRPGWRQP